MTMYLVRKSGNGKAHFWDGKDTKCRMASTGGLSMRRYSVTNDLNGRAICQRCMAVSSQQLPKVTNVTSKVTNLQDWQESGTGRVGEVS